MPFAGGLEGKSKFPQFNHRRRIPFLAGQERFLQEDRIVPSSAISQYTGKPVLELCGVLHPALFDHLFQSVAVTERPDGKGRRKEGHQTVERCR